MVRPLVLWAQQAPTLLNVLSRTSKWRVEVADFGDAGNLTESRLMDVPRYSGGRPEAVFVCTPDQIHRAWQSFPSAKVRVIWVCHNGKRDLIPADVEPHVTETLCFSRRVAALQRRSGVREHVIVPAYRARLQYRWEPNKLWAMLNRPKTRSGEHERDILEVAKASGIPMTVYGQDQEAGFLDDKAEVYGGCSGYVSSLPEWAGFGLSEHECFAAGVPVIGNVRWGDMVEELPHYGGLRSTLAHQVEAARRVSTDRAFAEELSERGLAFIERHRSQQRMDDGIEELLGG